MHALNGSKKINMNFSLFPTEILRSYGIIPLILINMDGPNNICFSTSMLKAFHSAIKIFF